MWVEGPLQPCKVPRTTLETTVQLADGRVVARHGAGLSRLEVVSKGQAPKRWLAIQSREEQIMATGTVKWYNDQKGYGFIQPDSGGKDVFVHATALERAGLRGLAEGQKVSYDVEADRRSGKESATNLKTA